MDANPEILPNLFRTEYSKMVAVLCSTFGLAHIQIAEDIVGDTFLLAAETWGKKGIPENQAGWLYTVAKNRTRDYLRRNRIRLEKVDPELQRQREESYEVSVNFEDEHIQDSQLRMMFAVCHPELDEKSQIILSLRILCGFGIEEIATALLSQVESINKRLYRAKKKLREKHIRLEFPPDSLIQARLDPVLRTLYLLFNEGYYSSVNKVNLRKDLCLEAIRLCLLLANNPMTQQPEVYAFLALMCFHTSRFEARVDGQNEFVLYENQNRELWNQELIAQGERYLNQASTGTKLSAYHLQAAIAFWHTQEDGKEKWENILQYYNLLLQVEYSPIAALNRTFAYAKVHGNIQAIALAEKLALRDNHFYFTLLGYLYTHTDAAKAISSYKQALKLARTATDKHIIAQYLTEVDLDTLE